MLLLPGWAAGVAQDQDAPPAPVYHAPADPGELLKLDEPMRRFFGERLRSRQPGSDQLRALVDAILKPDGLHFAYDIEGLFDVRETFRRRRGNCVSFAFLVAAIAREYDYRVSFQTVASALRWERYGGLIVSVTHLNVRLETGGETYRIDLRPDLIEGLDLRDMVVVDDKRAFAQFYATAGFFQLLHAQPEEAMESMLRATRIDPGCADAWANLAALQSHLGNLADARASFERALRADARSVMALDGYVTLLHRLGSPEDLRVAAQYERRVQAIRNRNPYYQQRLAELTQEQGDWAAAEKLWRRAIALKGDEPQFYEQWVAALHQLGREDEARGAAAKLEKLRRRLGQTSDHQPK